MKTPEFVVQHLMADHNATNVPTCERCHLSFSSMDAFAEHCKRTHVVNHYYCLECYKRYDSEAEVFAHLPVEHAYLYRRNDYHRSSIYARKQ